MSEPSPARPFNARLALWIAAAWVAAGALFKLLAGSPSDLPPSVQEFPLLRPAWTFRIAIGVELSVVILALLRPRVGWVALALLFGLFDFLLWQMMQAGEASCGCFGSNVPIKPWQMMAIDTLLLVGLLLTRSWRGFRPRPLKPAPLLPLFAVVIAAPWFMFHEARTTTIVDEATGQQTTQVTGEWKRFEPSTWEGSMIHDTDLAQFFDPPHSVDTIPPPAHVIVYRLSCEHCEEHFANMEPITDRALVLIRVPENKDSEENDVVSAVKPPATVEIELKDLPRGYGITTPVIFDLDELFVVHDVIERK